VVGAEAGPEQQPSDLSLTFTLKDTIMKTSTLFAAIALTVATTGAAFAQEATYDYPQAATSQKSRAEVVAELRQAQAEGTLHIGEASYRAPERIISTVTRAEVRAQTLAAIASGELAELNRSNHNGFEGVKFPASAATRMAGK
jgi:Domain of unknown function (DUF4148)